MYRPKGQITRYEQIFNKGIANNGKLKKCPCWNGLHRENRSTMYCMISQHFSVLCFSSRKLSVLGGHWDISWRNHSTHVYTTLGHHCRMCLLGSSPSGQKTITTKRLQWTPPQKKNIPTTTSLECCRCYVDKEIRMLCVLERLEFPRATYWLCFQWNFPLKISNERCQFFDIFILLCTVVIDSSYN